ncbi:NUDIX domain-containing protein [Weeksellaceae bacterium TAE3-ERU29]|nr:NUDIX domain-containing protein [Weeksellaceae bacterium TAE3-ERU29]
MFRVFINNTEVSFAKKPSKNPDCCNLIVTNKSIFRKIYDLCINDKFNDFQFIRIVDDKSKKCFKSFKSEFSEIKAAGGIVKNKENKFLMIYRMEHWDLPKGKIEKDEKKKQAALREVEEECGISNLEITKKIDKTYHMYELNGKAIFKTTCWYEMSYNGKEELIPQTEEDITEAKWCDKSFIKNVLENKKSYKNIELLLAKYVTIK